MIKCHALYMRGFLGWSFDDLDSVGLDAFQFNFMQCSLLRLLCHIR